MKKILAVLIAFISFIGGISTVEAAQVKEHIYQSGNVSVAIPYVSGSFGGRFIDSKINDLLYQNTLAKLSPYLDAETVNENKQADALEKQKLLSENTASVLVQRVDAALQNAAERAGQSGYYLKITNDVKLSGGQYQYLSLVQQVTAYSGGAHPNTNLETFNFDLHTGVNIPLGALFMEGADYQQRLEQMLYAWRKGEVRRFNAAYFQKYHQELREDFTMVRISGNEKYYFTPENEIVLIFAPYEIASYAEGIKECKIPLAILGDILKI